MFLAVQRRQGFLVDVRGNENNSDVGGSGRICLSMEDNGGWVRAEGDYII